MTTAACQDAFIFLHSCLNEGELEHGAMAQAARLFSVSHKAMALFWREMNKKIENGNFDVDDILANTLFFENNWKNRGRKLKWNRAELRAAVAALRTTFSSMGKAINVPRTMLHYMMKKEGMFCRHDSSLQPHLTEQHMAVRFAYALDEVHPVQ